MRSPKPDFRLLCSLLNRARRRVSFTSIVYKYLSSRHRLQWCTCTVSGTRYSDYTVPQVERVFFYYLKSSRTTEKRSLQNTTVVGCLASRMSHSSTGTSIMRFEIRIRGNVIMWTFCCQNLGNGYVSADSDWYKYLHCVFSSFVTYRWHRASKIYIGGWHKCVAGARRCMVYGSSCRHV